ncbi:MAG TPA: hypothetical protein PLX14_12475, partial [Anaerolineales bacterium]|nr:hypothetical protein [Anaerolineales bacterium]
MSKLPAVLLIVFLTLGLISPEANAASNSPSLQLHNNEPVCGTPVTIPLVTSSNQTRGTLTVANGQTKLFVTYTANAPWKIREMQVAAASSLSGIPVNQKGGPKVGNFPYMKGFSSTTTYTFNIPLTNLGNPIYIAAHADMSRYWNNSYKDWRGRWHDDWHEERTEVWA